MNLTELLVTQQNIDEISASFGLSEEQTLEAMGALIPAFSEGLKRQTSTPRGTAQFIEALSTGRHAEYADDPSKAISQSGIDDGNAILGHLFQSRDVSRAVASHAASSTGIDEGLFRQLLPVLASMVMGSLFQGATSQPDMPQGNAAVEGAGHNIGGGLGEILGEVLGGAAGSGSGGAAGGASGGGLLGQIIEGLAGGLLTGAGQATRRRRSPSRKRRSSPTGSLEDLLEQAMGGGSKSKRSRTRRPTTRKSKSRKPTPRRRNTQSGGLGGLLEDLLGQATGSGGSGSSRTRRTTPMPAEKRPSEQEQSGGFGDIFGDMLEPGGNTSREYQRQTESVFDDFLKS